MATKFIHPPLQASHVSPPKPSALKIKKIHRDNTFMSTHNKISIRFVDIPWSYSAAKASANDDVIIQDCALIKENLYAALQGINRGIFGVPSEKKTEIEKLVEVLESQNPTPQPTLCLEKAAGTWRLVYSTITILGSKRTKLGLRDFITLGDFLQSIDVAKGKAVNVIKFSARGLNLLNGQLTIDASFKIASESRVDITYINSVITPQQLMNVFRKNYDLLLGIFNPEGWLEITYVDDSLRIGRDDKGNVFILERLQEQE